MTNYESATYAGGNRLKEQSTAGGRLAEVKSLGHTHDHLNTLLSVQVPVGQNCCEYDVDAIIDRQHTVHGSEENLGELEDHVLRPRDC